MIRMYTRNVRESNYNPASALLMKTVKNNLQLQQPKPLSRKC